MMLIEGIDRVLERCGRSTWKRGSGDEWGWGIVEVPAWWASACEVIGVDVSSWFFSTLRSSRLRVLCGVPSIRRFFLLRFSSSQCSFCTAFLSSPGFLFLFGSTALLLNLFGMRIGFVAGGVGWQLIRNRHIATSYEMCQSCAIKFVNYHAHGVELRTIALK